MCVSLWRVSWNILIHRYGSDTLSLVDSETKFKAFTSKVDANDFVKALKDANTLIQNETYLCVKITKMDEIN